MRGTHATKIRTGLRSLVAVELLSLHAGRISNRAREVVAVTLDDIQTAWLSADEADRLARLLQKRAAVARRREAAYRRAEKRGSK